MDKSEILLRVRNLLEERALLTAQANHDTAKFGEWRCDYTIPHAQISAEIERILSENIESERA